MGQVYQATDTKLNRQVALKILPEAFATDPDRLARFQREAQVLASLNHPNIAAIYGLEEADDTRALVLELVEGSTLADRIAQGAIPVDEALPIAKQIAEALEAAHEAGVIHRDLKPANIKVKDDGTVKVLDFGLAKALDTAPEGDPSLSPTLTAAATQMGVIMGTAAYMSPEQARGKPVDKRADIWAFGCVFYEMLTGRRAFEGEDVSLTLAQVMTSQPELEALPQRTPLLVVGILRRSFEKDQRLRLRDVGEARVVLEGAESVASTGEVVSTAPRRIADRLGWVAAAVLGLVAVAFLLRSDIRTIPEQGTIRFTVPPPPETSIAPGPAAPQLAVSPDGRRLAFAAVDASGSSQLWVRDLDSTTSRPLQGTEDAQFPFWSPDGNSIGFQTLTHVKTVPLAGGGVSILCENDFTNGAAWSDAGVVIFAARTGLMRVSSDGGIPQTLTTLGAAEQETAHFWPQFLPDNNHFLYFIESSDEQRQGIYVSSLEGDPPTRVMSSPVRAVFAAGHLFFLRGATLMAQPLDLQEFRLVDDPVPVAQDVTYNPVGTKRSSVSASDGGVIAFRTGGIGGTPTSRLVWFDRDGDRLGTVGAPGPYGSLSLSPDDSRLAFDRVDSTTGTSDIWLHDLQSGREEQFTFDIAADRAPVFSPNGRQVAFWSSRDDRPGLYRKDASGSGDVELLLAFVERIEPMHWSDSHLVLGTRGGSASRNLMRMTVEGDRQTTSLLETDGSEFDARLSPDRRWLAYVSNFSGRNEVYVSPYPDVEGGRRRISPFGGTDPSWRGDGTELFYLDPQNTLVAVSVNGDRAAFEYGAPQELFRASVSSLAFAYRNPYVATSDGQRFLVNVQDPDPSPISVVVNWLPRTEP